MSEAACVLEWEKKRKNKRRFYVIRARGGGKSFGNFIDQRSTEK